MCAILGYYSPEPQPEHLNTLRALFLQSKIRGLHSFGYSYLSPSSEGIQTEKFLTVEELLTSVGKLKSILPNTLIGHCRFSTSGDYHIISNNQPLVPFSNSSLVFNGVISMKLKEEMEQDYGVELLTDNDGEIFLRELASGRDPAQFLDTIGSFAGCYLWGNKGYVIRNYYRPAYYAQYQNALWVASTRDIFRRAIPSLEDVRPVPELTLLEFQQLMSIFHENKI